MQTHRFPRMTQVQCQVEYRVPSGHILLPLTPAIALYGTLRIGWKPSRTSLALLAKWARLQLCRSRRESPLQGWSPIQSEIRLGRASHREKASHQAQTVVENPSKYSSTCRATQNTNKYASSLSSVVVIELPCSRDLTFHENGQKLLCKAGKERSITLAKWSWAKVTNGSITTWLILGASSGRTTAVTEEVGLGFKFLFSSRVDRNRRQQFLRNTRQETK
eukprot:m.91304 g.91304  ORF g.91304 m.91304 type:complete len:220 (-) comp12941_c0_seq9:29-688(-)